MLENPYKDHEEICQNVNKGSVWIMRSSIVFILFTIFFLFVVNIYYLGRK